MTQAAASAIDVSVVMNVHRDETYFRRSMMSLEAAVRYAGFCGLRIELVVVLDRPNAASAAWFAAYDASQFDALRIIEVDNGCLGLSRNDGIRAACGDFVATYDADDLVSFNYIAALHHAALRAPEKSIVFPEYLLGFGVDHYLRRYRPRPDASWLAFVTDHPFVSRHLTRRATFDEVGYADLRLSTGYAYEDWHLNAELAGRGYELCVAPATTIYYRQRRGSLGKASERLSVGQVPAARLFEPDTFATVCADDYARFRRGERFAADAAATRAEFLASRLNLVAALAANAIDPAIDVSVIGEIPAYTNAGYDLRPGAAYFELACEVRGLRFSDVVLLPFMTTGGGEKYILAVLDTLAELDPTRRFLVVTGQGGVRHKWIERLPAGSVFLDIFHRFPQLTRAQREVLVLKLIQTTAPEATLHLKCCAFAQDFFNRFAPVLTRNRTVYYRFADPIRRFAGFDIVNGYGADFLSGHMERLDIVISDNERVMRSDLERMDGLAGKDVCLPTLCELADAAPRETGPRARGRLLWASRLDPEKRPELLHRIAVALGLARPDLSIDVWGESFSGFDAAPLARLANVRVRGGYSGFASLDPWQYDAFVYTTAYDGLPNVVIEAMASGLPVIAPDIGGIPEAVRDGETGVLLRGHLGDDELVAAYVEAVGWLYDADDRIATLGRNASAHVRARHGAHAFKSRVAAIFGRSAAEPVLEVLSHDAS